VSAAARLPVGQHELFCSNAARGGHLELLTWAREQEHGCPWDEETCSLRRSGRAPGVAAVGSSAPLPVETELVCIDGRCKQARCGRAMG
jgi:hypothetical protein